VKKSKTSETNINSKNWRNEISFIFATKESNDLLSLKK
jgi:hypothetical protein